MTTTARRQERPKLIDLRTVRYLGRNQFLIPSRTRGIRYLVDIDRGSCQCPGFYYRGVCPHLVAVTRCRACAGELFIDYAWVGGRGHVLMLRCANTCGFGAWLGRAD